MCTAIRLNKQYFGRTLDLEYNYNEKIIIVPKNYKLKYRYTQSNSNHYSFFGIGIIENNYPLLYDGCNEHGLCIAGLNLSLSTTYNDYITNKTNICSFELIPWILSNCINCIEAKKLLIKTNITNDSFNNNYPVSKLHFIICDKNNCFVLEIINKKIIITDNPYDVLTNEPCFEFHKENIKYYSNISNKTNGNIKGLNLIGIPGDNLSKSRFIKSYISKKYLISESKNISEIFNVFNCVFELNGLNLINDNKYYKTIYIVFYDYINKLVYFKTFKNSQIYCVDLLGKNVDELISRTIYIDEEIKKITLE